MGDVSDVITRRHVEVVSRRSQSVFTVDAPGFGPTRHDAPSAATPTRPGCRSTSAVFDPV